MSFLKKNHNPKSSILFTPDELSESQPYFETQNINSISRPTFSKEQLKKFVDISRSFNPCYQHMEKSFWQNFSKYSTQYMGIFGIFIFMIAYFMQLLLSENNITPFLIYGMSLVLLTASFWRNFVENTDIDDEESFKISLNLEISQFLEENTNIQEELNKSLFTDENKEFWLKNLDWYFESSDEKIFLMSASYSKENAQSKERFFKDVSNKYSSTHVNAMFLGILSEPEETFINKIIGDIYEP